MILGKRVRLRAIERDDLPKFVQWLNDPEVIRGLALHTPMSMDQEQSWFDAMRSHPADEQPLGIEIHSGEGWVHIGNLSLNKINWVDREAEVGIVIGDKRYWSQGYGREAMILLLRYGFYTLGLNRIFLRVYATNPRAIRSYEKAGFINEGKMRQAHYQDGQYVDVLLMSALHSEWKDDEAV
jgi:diamine N-acetyltransferase